MGKSLISKVKTIIICQIPLKELLLNLNTITSLLLVQSKISNRYKFFFSAVNKTNVVQKEIKNINPKKTGTKNNILSRIVKQSHKASSNFLQKLVNDAIISGKVSRRSEISSITPVLKEKP